MKIGIKWRNDWWNRSQGTATSRQLGAVLILLVEVPAVNSSSLRSPVLRALFQLVWACSLYHSLAPSLPRICSSNTRGITFCTSKWSCVWRLSWTILPQRTGHTQASRTTMGSPQHQPLKPRGRQRRRPGPTTPRPPSITPLWHMYVALAAQFPV